MKGIRWAFQITVISPTILLLALLTASAETQVHPERIHLDKSNLEEIEDLSESMANSLLDFSTAVRRMDLSEVSHHFAETVHSTSFAGQAPALDRQVKWISFGSAKLSHEETRAWDKAEYVDLWAQFLGRYRSLEDARFKVKDAEFSREDGIVRGSGGIKFFLVGDSTDGRPLWVKGTGKIHAMQKNDSETWKIEKLLFDEIAIQKSERRLFSEVSEPAGVSVSLPPYGSPGNDDFIYRGAAVGDLNGNGFVDLVVTGIKQTYVYLNQGDGTFLERAWDLGIPPNSRATAPLLLDFDNDCDLDIFISGVGTQMLFENRLVPDGELVFRDISAESGVSLPAYGFSAVAGDVTGNGFPDIYVTSYNAYGTIMPNSWHRATNGTPNLLFINQGDGTFKESARAWGVQDARWSYAAQILDIDGDGKMDIYVANDFGENALFMNRGDHFVDEAEARGVLDPGNGMGVAFGDYDNDGIIDLYVTNMSSTAGNRILERLMPDTEADDHVLRKLAAGNSLFKGNPDGTFSDVTGTAGPFVAGWAWGGVFYDFDNDGWDDLYSTNGFVTGQTMKDT